MSQRRSALCSQGPDSADEISPCVATEAGDQWLGEELAGVAMGANSGPRERAIGEIKTSPGGSGLLFYGPPGTSKTYTIHYLASQLPNHTTFLVTAEEVVLLGDYFTLARFLQPSIMVIEDVDLIARERTHMHGPYEEALLNKLLNEMDGLREDARGAVYPDQESPRPDRAGAGFTPWTQRPGDRVSAFRRRGPGGTERN
jgi:hypothetical protein